ncbi:hypothetical protein ATCCBAA256_27510 [Mycobacterium montefiorense]|nr:hypothetical protein ATCCBAA256_27510 [Mycobacterium montefiorense]
MHPQILQARVPSPTFNKHQRKHPTKYLVGQARSHHPSRRASIDGCGRILEHEPQAIDG